MVTRSRINKPDRKINDLAFADDIALLENDVTQPQFDELKHNASQVDMEINIDKIVQMCLNENDRICNDNLIVNG